MSGPSFEGTMLAAGDTPQPRARPESDPPQAGQAVREPPASSPPLLADGAAQVEAEVLRLEQLLAARAQELLAARAELDRLQGLLRDSVERFDEVLTRTAPPPEPAEHARQRELAVARALEAEAARAEIGFRLDELMGHLAAAGAAAGAEAAEGAEPGETLNVTCARLSGTVRGLMSARAEIEESRDSIAARLVLVEHDLDQLRGRHRSLERELAEAREQAELEQVATRGLDAQLQGALRAPDAETLRGELAGLRARSEESERAFVAAASEVATARAGMPEVLEWVAAARTQLDAMRVEISELKPSLARETEKNREAAEELARGAAERIVLRDALARAQHDAAVAREELQRIHSEQSRAGQGIATALDQARLAQLEQRGRVLELQEGFRDVRQVLEQLAGALDRGPGAHVFGDGESAASGEPTQPGMPTYIEAIEGLEEQLTLRDQRILELSAQLAHDRGRLLSVQEALRRLRATGASEPFAAERVDQLLALFGSTDSWRP
jgi:chromosome segregation ATPase